jgi:hypothetical protein
MLCRPTQNKNRRYVKPNIAVGKVGYKWKSAVDKELLYFTVVSYSLMTGMGTSVKVECGSIK